MGCSQSTAARYAACSQLATASDIDEPKDFVFVYNLPPEISAEKLEKKFQKFGEISRVRIFNKGASYWYAYIEFQRKSSAMKAIQASQLMIRGHRVSIKETAPSSM